MATLQEELQYFKTHQSELVKKYNGKYIVIKDDKVDGAYNDVATAYLEAIKKFAPGTFFIQQCIPGKEAYSQSFNSRAIFA